jgi:hypothetical protein
MAILDGFAGLRVRKNCGESEICEVCTTFVIHKDTRPLEISMDDTTGMEVVQSVGNIK